MDNAVIFLFISVIVVGVVLMVIIGITRRLPNAIHKEEYQKKWLSIEQSVGNDHGSMQLAVLSADKLVDEALKQKGFSGNTMGERMKSAKNSFSDRNGIWYAHKLRNQIAHETSFTISSKQTKTAMQSFKRGLRDLGVI